MNKLNNQPKKNLFIVESPFQFLSAIEAQNRYLKDYNILIIKYHTLNKQNTNEQLSSLKNLSTWNKVVEIKPLFFRHEANIVLFIMLLKYNFLKINYFRIFIGEFRSIWMRTFINVLKPVEYFTLDDGNIIIELQKNYIHTGSFPLCSRWDHYSWNFAKAILNTLHINHSIEFNYNVFTCFEIFPHTNDQIIIRHHFEFLKLQSKNKEIKPRSVYFFGGNLSEISLISENDELLLLREIIRYYKSLNYILYYIPHRREKKNKIDKIKNSLGSNILWFDSPAELKFITQVSHPEIIASFFSTALYTISQMYNFSSIDSFVIPYEKINSAYKNDIINIYNDYSKFMHIIYL